MIYWPIHRHLFMVKVQARAVYRFMPWSNYVIQPFLKNNSRTTVNEKCEYHALPMMMMMSICSIYRSSIESNRFEK